MSIGCLSSIVLVWLPVNQADEVSGWTPAFPSLASCVICVVVSPAIPEVAGDCAD